MFAAFGIINILLLIFLIGIGIYVTFLLIIFLKRGRQAFDIYIDKNKNN